MSHALILSECCELTGEWLYRQLSCNKVTRGIKNRPIVCWNFELSKLVCRNYLKVNVVVLI